MKHTINTRVNRFRNWLNSPAGVWFVFFVVWAICSYIFYRRFPNNFTQPNFYAEDGKVFAANIVSHGFIRAIFTTFNGYFIIGLYFLETLAFAINRLAFGGELVTVPQTLALVSYGFLGLLAALPIVALRRHIGMVWLVALAFMVSIVPMPGSDYAVIGTIGNLKFAFLYLAVVLLVYRHKAPSSSKGIWLADLALLLCCYTDITIYALLPFAVLRYLPKLWKNPKRGLIELAKDSSFVSLIILGLLLLPQLVIIKLHGIPKMPGYLDAPFQPRRTVEIYLWRTYLYAFFYALVKHFNDLLALLLFGFGSVMLLIHSWRNKYFFVSTLGLYSALVGTLLFVLNRTGISDFFFGYKASGPDQFFYAQNMIMYLIAVIALERLTRHWRGFLKPIPIALLLLAVLVPYRYASTYGANTFMADTSGVAIADMKKACVYNNNPNISFVVYPTPEQIFTAPRSQVCTSKVAQYKLQDERSLGLEPFHNNYLAEPGSINNFTQTFVAQADKLDGISLYVSTFAQHPKTDFRLTLYDENCHNRLTDATIKGGELQDNKLHQIIFDTQTASAGKIYCFSLAPITRAHISPIAVQLSQPEAYPQGQTVINGRESSSGIVFRLLYEQD